LKLKNSISYISKKIILICFLIGSLSYGQNNNFKVALDAGHERTILGLLTMSCRKNIALAVVLKVGRILEVQNRCYLYQKTDVL
jgi:hypothetical protein